MPARKPSASRKPKVGKKPRVPQSKRSAVNKWLSGWLSRRLLTEIKKFGILSGVDLEYHHNRRIGIILKVEYPSQRGEGTSITYFDANTGKPLLSEHVMNRMKKRGIKSLE